MDKKINLEHTIRNIVRESVGVSGKDKPEGTSRSFLKPVGVISPPKGEEHPGTKKTATILAQRGEDKVQHGLKNEETIEEKYVGGQKPLKPTDKQKSDLVDTIKNIPGAADAAARGFAGSATFGGANYVAAAGDYALKNLGSMVGLGKGTTFDKELKQEYEKDEKAKKEHPTAFAAGEWAPLALGGTKVAVSAAKAAPAAIKAIPGAVKDFTKWYAKSSPIDTVKAGARALGGDIISNPIKYAKEIPSTAKGMAKFGAGLEVADKSVGMPELVGGQGWKKGAIYNPEKRKEMFSPGGGTKTIQDIGKKAAEMAAPGSVEAGKAAVKGDWDKAGREATKAVVGATLVNPNLGRFVYDAAASSIAPKYSLTGEGGVSDRIYNKIKKIKESKENLNEGNPALKGGFDWLTKAVTDKLAKETAAKAAKEAAEAAKAAKGKPAPKQPSPGKTEPGREGAPVRRDNDNVPPRRDDKVVPIRRSEPGEWPPLYKPGKDFPNFPPPANPNKPIKSPITPSPEMPSPGQDPFRVSPPVKTPKEKPQRPPDQNPFPDKPAEVKPKAPPIELPKLEPPPYTSPKLPSPAAKPFVEPGGYPAAKPEPGKTKPIEGEPAPVAQPEQVKKKQAAEEPAPVIAPEKKPEHKKEESKPLKKEEPKKGKEKPPRRILPFAFPVLNIDGSPLAGMSGTARGSSYTHTTRQYIKRERVDESADEERRSIENVARPKSDRKKAVKQAEIIRKIIEEKKATRKKSTATVEMNPKIKNPEADQ